MPLILTLPETETFDERTMQFLEHPPVTLVLEHSLLSISKWERTWKKPFMSKEEKTNEEFLDYINCMAIKPIPPNVMWRIGNKEKKQIVDYIHDPMTATTFHSLKKEKPSNETVTSELVYYWMSAAQIPWDAEKWHFNRLMTLIRIHSIKNDSSKMSKKESGKYQHSINKARRAKRPHK